MNEMQIAEKFIVVPFRRGRRNALAMGEMRQASSVASAERLADNMADRFAGVAAYAVMVDKDTGDMSEPRLLRRHGETIDLTVEG